MKFVITFLLSIITSHSLVAQYSPADQVLLYFKLDSNYQVIDSAVKVVPDKAEYSLVFTGSWITERINSNEELKEIIYNEPLRVEYVMPVQIEDKQESDQEKIAFLIKKGDKYLKDGDLKKSREAYFDAIAIDDRYHAPYYKLALYYKFTGKNKLYELYRDKAISLGHKQGS